MFQNRDEFYRQHLSEYGFEKIFVLNNWSDMNSNHLIQAKNQSLRDKKSNMIYSEDFTYETHGENIYLVLAFKYELVSKLCLTYSDKTETNT